jgi:hypothetical protein
MLGANNALRPDVRFSNRPFGVKRFQTIHRCSVDVAHGLVLLFGIGTNHPENRVAGTHRIRFRRELLIERDDFMENPPKKFVRLSPGAEVRLCYACFVTRREVVKNAAGPGQYFTPSVTL